MHINCKGVLLSLENPVVMSILNNTADSFYKGHLKESLQTINHLAGNMIKDGAKIIDVGGQSTKPGSTRLSAMEETDRIIPVIESIKVEFPDLILSVDTYHHRVAEYAIHAGASIINDISGGNMDESMIETSAKLNVPYVCMHMQGVPETMQQNPTYKNLIKEILDFFVLKIMKCNDAGIKDIIIDPGFGFGKTIQQNLQLLKNLEIFSALDKPILAGLSRKSTIFKTLGITANDSLNGTTVLNTIALNNGARILRVHDVKEAVEAVKLYNAYQNATSN
ncbi:MAG: dihydropteroate synthase [Ferruginibacter sp.]|nr:dihydropteroate synthase [Ferruginibacter sp.]